MKTLTGLQAKKYILDPIHGPIPITTLELEIISTPVFQRLRNVSQLSLASLIFPGATHNRFQHCLGTVYVMDKLLYNLKLENKLPSDNETLERIIQKMRVAALLHDCGQLPFSHTFENMYDKGNHEYFGKYIIEKSIFNKILRNYEIDGKSIGELLTGKVHFEDPDANILIQLLPLIHSDADADRMDYLLRDSYFTGVPYGKVDIDRICNFVSLHEGLICFRQKAQDALEHFLFSRYQMYKIVYIHKTVICYELLLQKLYKDYIKKYFEDLNLPFFLPKLDAFKTSSENWFTETFYNLTEFSFFKSIQILLKSDKIEINDKENLSRLYSRITNRVPIKNCFHYDDLAESSEKEYCDQESDLYKELERNSAIINHWSFLRHDPSKPIRIASPIKGDIDDIQDPEQIRIVITGSNSNDHIVLLQNRTNSVIKSLSRHYRILISYYHDDKNSQNTIKQLANKYISQSSAKVNKEKQSEA